MPAGSMSAGCSVTANDLTVVHWKSLGMMTAFPDVCLTPDKAGAPVPYTNVALSDDAVNTCATVFCDGQPVMKFSSCLYPSYGDEAGAGGGLVSGCNKGQATFLTASPDVLFEGERAPRHLDLMGANHMSPPNIYSYLVQVLMKLGLREMLCIAFCACNKKFFKMMCFRPLFADPVSAWPDFGFWLGPYWDSRLPGVWLEVPYDMTKKPPTMIKSDIDSAYQEDEGGHPLKMPATWWQSWGSRIPDVVETKNPDLPPTDKNNIRNIYELKFDGDREREGQFADQAKIAGGNKKFHVLDAESCGCDKRDKTNEDAKQASQEAEAAVLNQTAMQAWAKAEREANPNPAPAPNGFPENYSPDGQWDAPRPGDPMPAAPGLYPGPAPGGIRGPVPGGVRGVPLPGARPVPGVRPGIIRPVMPGGGLTPIFGYAPSPSGSGGPVVAAADPIGWEEAPMSIVAAMEQG